MLFTDDHTHISWVNFLSYKYKAFEKFQEFKTFVKKESEYALKFLCTDRGGEFLSDEFVAFLKKKTSI